MEENGIEKETKISPNESKKRRKYEGKVKLNESTFSHSNFYSSVTFK